MGRNHGCRVRRRSGAWLIAAAKRCGADAAGPDDTPLVVQASADPAVRARLGRDLARLLDACHGDPQVVIVGQGSLDKFS